MCSLYIEGTSSPGPSSQIPLIVGLTVGVVLISSVMVAVIVIFVSIKRRKTSIHNVEQVYDYVTDPQPPTLPERFNVKDNEAYGNLHQVHNVAYGVVPPASQSEVTVDGSLSSVSLQPNKAYGVVPPASN